MFAHAHVRGPWGRRVTSRLVSCIGCLSNHTGMRIALCCPDYFAGNPCGNINTDMQRCTHTRTHTVIVLSHFHRPPLCISIFLCFPMTISDWRAALASLPSLSPARVWWPGMRESRFMKLSSITLIPPDLEEAAVCGCCLWWSLFTLTCRHFDTYMNQNKKLY